MIDFTVKENEPKRRRSLSGRSPNQSKYRHTTNSPKNNFSDSELFVNDRYKNSQSQGRRVHLSPIKPVRDQMENNVRFNSLNSSSRSLDEEKFWTPPTSPSQMYFSKSNEKLNLLAYAGAKFHDPPSPKLLPKPPVHWVIPHTSKIGDSIPACSEMTNILKLLLNVQT